MRVPAAVVIERSDVDDVAVLRLAHGPVQALDLELVRAISSAFDGLMEDPAAAVVVTGTGTTFSGGVDLWRLADGGATYANALLPALGATLEAIFTFPKPVVAAVNGHALAGGCVIALACDRRLASAGEIHIGLTELAAGLPFPSAALEIVRYALGDRGVHHVALAGARMSGAEALSHGLVDEVVDPAHLLRSAIDRARSMAMIPARTFRLTKSQLRADAVRRIAMSRAQHDDEVAANWGSRAAAEGIAEYMAQVKAG